MHNRNDPARAKKKKKKKINQCGNKQLFSMSDSVSALHFA